MPQRISDLFGTTLSTDGVGIISATQYIGAVTGNVTGEVTGNVTGNVTGTATTASSLSPTASITTVGVITASSFVGSLTGTATTATTLSADANINTTGIITALNVSVGSSITAGSFYGDGSGLTNITAVSALDIEEEGSLVGAATTINFVGDSITATYFSGIATVTVTAAAAGGITEALAIAYSVAL